MNQTRTARDRLDRVLSMLGRARRFAAPALVLLFVGALAATGYAFVRKRVYTSETLILYREGIRSSDILGGEGETDRARKLGLRLKEMVLSRTRLESIIKEKKLYPEIVDERGLVDAVDEMRKHIAFRVQDGDTFGLSFEGHEPKGVQEVTARLAGALIAENSRSNSEQAEVTKEFLDREADRTQKELKERETQLAQFLVKHPEFARENVQTNSAGSAIRAAQSHADAQPKGDPTLASLEREAARLKERLGMPGKRRSAVDADPALVAVKQDAENDLRIAQKELAEKSAEYTEEHPDVRAAKAHLKRAQDKLKRANDALSSAASTQPEKSALKDEDEGTIDRGALENELRRVQQATFEYKAKRKKLEGNEPSKTLATSVVALETEWTQLNREVADARDRFQSLQDKEFKASMAESAAATGRTAEMVVVDAAFLPTHPKKPGRSTIVAVGFGVAAALSFLLALGLALLDDRLYDRVDVERLGLLPLVGVVPKPTAARGSARG